MPSIRGIFKSVTTMAGLHARAFSQPSIPSRAVSVWYPQPEISSARPIRAWGSSSTIKTFTGLCISSFDADISQWGIQVQHSRWFPDYFLSSLDRLFGQFGPTGVKSVVFLLRRVEFPEGGLQSLRVGSDCRVFDPFASRCEPGVGGLHPFLNRGKLARLEIRQLLFRGLLDLSFRKAFLSPD